MQRRSALSHPEGTAPTFCGRSAKACSRRPRAAAWLRELSRLGIGVVGGYAFTKLWTETS
jgi:hypothetical protein